MSEPRFYPSARTSGTRDVERELSRCVHELDHVRRDLNSARQSLHDRNCLLDEMTEKLERSRLEIKKLKAENEGLKAIRSQNVSSDLRNRALRESSGRPQWSSTAAELSHLKDDLWKTADDVVATTNGPNDDVPFFEVITGSTPETTRLVGYTDNDDSILSPSRTMATSSTGFVHHGRQRRRQQQKKQQQQQKQESPIFPSPKIGESSQTPPLEFHEEPPMMKMMTMTMNDKGGSGHRRMVSTYERTKVGLQILSFIGEVKKWSRRYTAAGRGWEPRDLSPDFLSRATKASAESALADILSGPRTCPMMVTRYILEIMVERAFNISVLRGFGPGDETLGDFWGAREALLQQQRDGKRMLSPERKHLVHGMQASAVTRLRSLPEFTEFMARRAGESGGAVFRALRPFLPPPPGDNGRSGGNGGSGGIGGAGPGPGPGLGPAEALADFKDVWTRGCALGIDMLCGPHEFRWDFVNGGAGAYFNPGTMRCVDPDVPDQADAAAIKRADYRVRLGITPVVTITTVSDAHVVNPRAVQPAEVLLFLAE